MSTHRKRAARSWSGWCLDAHDLALSKYVAAREKDDRFVRAAMAGKLIEVQTLLERLSAMPVDEATRERVRRRIS